MDFDQDILSKFGIEFNSDEEASAFSALIQEELEVRIGEEISKRCSDEQLEVFDSLLGTKEASEWLGNNVPDYRVIVHQKIDEIEKELIKYGKDIIRSKQNDGESVSPEIDLSVLLDNSANGNGGESLSFYCPKCGNELKGLNSCKKCGFDIKRDTLLCIEKIDDSFLGRIEIYLRQEDSISHNGDKSASQNMVIDSRDAQYTITEEIETGKIIKVYKGIDNSSQMEVIIKEIGEYFVTNYTAVFPFVSLIPKIIGLNHPNIVKVLDVVKCSASYDIIMESINGITLERYLDKKKALSEKNAISIALSISYALKCAHDRNVYHGTLSPKCIMISIQGKVQVCDFGIFRFKLDEDVLSDRSYIYYYAAPEIDRWITDEKQDIYSLGIILYEMITGKRPFEGETIKEIHNQHIYNDMISPKEIRPDISYSTERIIYRCCKKDPEDRYMSMEDLIEDLRKALVRE